MIKKFVLFIVTILIPLSLHAKKNYTDGQSPEKRLIPGYTIHSDKEKGFSVIVPDGWTKKENQPGNTAVRLYSGDFKPGKQGGNIGFSFHYSNNLSLNEYFKQSLLGLKNYIKDYKTIKMGKSTISGLQCKWVLFTGKVGEYKFKFIQYYFVEGDSVCLVTATAFSHQFKNYKAQFKQIIKSFRWKKEA